MPIYTVKKIYQYTETVEVEAGGKLEALRKAKRIEGDRNDDDHLYDCKVIDEREEKEDNANS